MKIFQQVWLFLILAIFGCDPPSMQSPKNTDLVQADSITNTHKPDTITEHKKDSLYEWNKEYKSEKYGYSVRVPESFQKTPARKPHIDLKFIDAFGSSIIINVTTRLDEEYSITAHDYTKELLEETFKKATPNYLITSAEKIFVSGEKAFLIESVNSYPNLKSMECYLFHNSFAYVITGTCEISRFSNYRILFRNCINSIKL